MENSNPSSREWLMMPTRNLFSFLIAFASVLMVCINASLFDVLSNLRMTACLLVIIGVHVLAHEKIIYSLEHKLYAALFFFMLLAVLWTENKPLAINTLLPALNFVLVSILFSSLTVLGELRASLYGLLSGCLVGIAIVTLVTGFPFSYPEGFSYNSIALIYLLGIFLTILVGGFSRKKILYMLVVIGLMGLLMATTSIKGNVGVLIGAVSATVVFYRDSFKYLFRYSIPMVVLVAAISFYVASDEDLAAQIDSGITRVSLGLELLQVRNETAYSGFTQRTSWIQFGLTGWSHSPIIGYGVEAIRNDVGITSHTTFVDLLYNFGLIGLVLFYSVFAALVYRVWRSRTVAVKHIRPLIFAAMTCLLSITLTGTMYYSAILAAIIGVSVGLLSRPARMNKMGV